MTSSLAPHLDPTFQDVFDMQHRLQQRWCWRAGVLHGTSLMYHSQGHVIEELPFEHGKLHGLSKTYDTQGNVERALPYQQGVLHGEAVFYQNGLMTMKMMYEDGQPHGPCFFMYPHQKPQTQMLYRQGMIHGLMTHWDEQGRITYRCPYENNAKHGVEEIFYSETGQLLSQTSFECGVIEGDVVSFYPNGSVQRKAFYKKGEIVDGPFLYDIKGRALTSP